MLNVTYKPFILSVVMLNIVMLNVVMLSVVALLPPSLTSSSSSCLHSRISPEWLGTQKRSQSIFPWSKWLYMLETICPWNKCMYMLATVLMEVDNNILLNRKGF
jgi:hypothetical protein